MSANSQDKKLKKIMLSISGVMMSICAILGYYNATLPDSYYVEKGENLSFSTFLDIEASPPIHDMQSSAMQTLPLSNKNTLKLFGVIPIKNVEVTTVEPPMLVVGGNPFGIKLLMDGVMVVGIGEVDGQTGVCCPANTAGIEKGDIIVSIDGEPVDSNNDVQNIIANSNGEAVTVVLTRKSQEMQVSLKPIYSEIDSSYKAGLWVRDSSAGIGTVTFYDPTTGRFGGLGHPVCDVDTGDIIPLSSGEVVGVDISGVKKGEVGIPGELQGSFTSDIPIGSLYLNNRYGVFGTLSAAPNATPTIPMALKQDVQTGQAVIRTTLKGNQPKEYKIEIEKVDYKSTDSSKNMVIRVTDEELLNETGGIIQGMSGSPIIQNGKLVGAVTHVFVNEPNKGYAIFAENMYEFGARS